MYNAPLMSVAADLIWLEADAPGPHASLLDRHLVVGVRRAASADLAQRWVSGVYDAKEAWTRDFGGEQFALGRAFYTHLEQDKLREYFADAKASNARVERASPGSRCSWASSSRASLAIASIARADFCGAGVHVFPHDEKVAGAGGVVHFDTEGLPVRHLATARRALSFVLMLQPPEAGVGSRFGTCATRARTPSTKTSSRKQTR